MTRRTFLTYEDRKEIERLIKLGYTNKEIAQHISSAPSTISYELSRCENKSLYSADKANEHFNSLRKKNDTLSLDEEDLILNHFNNGLSRREILEITGLSTNKIRRVIYSCYSRGSIKTTINKDELNELEQRVSALEYQVEILTDMLKERL